MYKKIVAKVDFGKKIITLTLNANTIEEGMALIGVAVKENAALCKCGNGYINFSQALCIIVEEKMVETPEKDNEIKYSI